MPVHDWARVDAGILHHFHFNWIASISNALNAGLLPPGYYALGEQIAGGLGPDVLTLHRPPEGAPPDDPAGGIALATAPPRGEFHQRAEEDLYAAKSKVVVIRHTSKHQVIAVVEIVSPGNKSNRHGIRAFVQKAVEMLRAGVHLLVVDLFPPGPRDPKGLHNVIWDEFGDTDFALSPDRPLTLASYLAGRCPEAFIRTAAVGGDLPEMPLFLTPEVYVPVPLAATYDAAWPAVPAYWREVLERPAES
jgi:hypothetical protein